MEPIIGLFVKSPEPGEVKTRLGETVGMDSAASFYETCLAWILLRLHSEEIPFVLFYAPEQGLDPLLETYPILKNVECHPQQGSDLGERMLNALVKLRESYDRSALLLGSDSPDLPMDYVYEASEKLSGSDVVIGPAFDGGYYLIGMDEPYERLFLDMEWSHSNVLNETLRRAKEDNLKVELLPKWRDYDRLEDLLAVLDD